ncbi:uncharacterized protein LOC111317602 [Durio zibethinus]|uniref:Uncharacterized protein LOC111317602 n=1 Tax=Durio zibethinus TaxID=66656 RepID=A0A6P6BFC6_DURZI|nr:uncharacterized protein LOC111317602 [Durio zibethinus]
MDEAEASDGFSDWEQIQAPTYSTPPLTTSGEHDNHPQHQHDLSVFPPSRHEGLRITSDDDDDDDEEEEEEEVHVHDESEVNSSVGSWSSTGDEANSRPLKKTNEIGKILTNWIVKVGARVRCHMAFGWGFWPVGAVTGAVAAVLLSLMYAKVRKWRARIKEDKKDRLIFLIQEKDQKINQLLVQIAQMNELLSARRRVPVFRVS